MSIPRSCDFCWSLIDTTTKEGWGFYMDGDGIVGYFHTECVEMQLEYAEEMNDV